MRALRSILDVTPGEVARASQIAGLEVAEDELDPAHVDLHATRIEQLIEPLLAHWSARS